MAGRRTGEAESNARVGSSPRCAVRRVVVRPTPVVTRGGTEIGEASSPECPWPPVGKTGVSAFIKGDRDMASRKPRVRDVRGDAIRPCACREGGKKSSGKARS